MTNRAPTVRAPHAVVLLEDAGELVRGNAGPAISDRHPHVPFPGYDADTDVPGLGAVLAGVVQQVCQRLGDVVAVE